MEKVDFSYDIYTIYFSKNIHVCVERDRKRELAAGMFNV